MQPPSSQVFLCWENWLYCFLIILDFADMWGESKILSLMPFGWFLRGLEPCQAVGGLRHSKNNQSLIPNIPDSTNLSLHMLGMTADHCRSWEKRHIPDSLDFSLTLQSNHGYLQFWVFFCQKINLAKSGGVHHSPGFYPESLVIK